MSIPKIIHRTVPEVTTAEVEGWWERWQDLHPHWMCLTWRDPLDPADFPLTSAAWHRCTSGAQRAGLIRLELLLTHAGIYVDSDVEPIRRLDPLLHLEGFSAWESPTVTPDAVMGARAGHPAVRRCLDLALERIEQGAWVSGPGVTTEVLPGRDDWLLLPPASFYPYYFNEPERADDDFAALPWVMGVHRWHGSWNK